MVFLQLGEAIKTVEVVGPVMKICVRVFYIVQSKVTLYSYFKFSFNFSLGLDSLDSFASFESLVSLLFCSCD